MMTELLPISTFDKNLELLVSEGTGKILEAVTSDRSLTPTALASETESLQNKMVDHLLDESFIGQIDPSLSDSRTRQRLAFAFRQRVMPLRIPFPEPVLEIGTRSWAYAGAFGAILGMLIGGPLMHYLLDMRDIGIILGAAAGSLLFLMLVGYLVQRPKMLRLVQGAFGAATVLELAAMTGAAVNPLGLLWRRIRRTFGGRGMINSMKRIMAYLAGILVLQMAVPRARVRQDQLESNTRESLASWLRYHLNILLLLAETMKDQPETISPAAGELPTTLLDAIRKLTLVPPGQRHTVTDEILQEFRNAGFDTESTETSPAEFNASLRDQYDIIGLIAPGDPVKILTPPIIRNGRVIIRGRLTRKRDRQ